jgi:hypothetical protein
MLLLLLLSWQRQRLVLLLLDLLLHWQHLYRLLLLLLLLLLYGQQHHRMLLLLLLVQTSRCGSMSVAGCMCCAARCDANSSSCSIHLGSSRRYHRARAVPNTAVSCVAVLA